jgi:hypothetical protein
MKKLLFLIISVMALSACSDEFLVTENKNSLDVGSFFKTENDLLLATNAAYCPLAHGGMFGQKYFFIINTLDPYIWFENPKGGMDQMIININDFQDFWNTLYIGLFRTSDILANISRLKNIVEPAKYNEYEGQLKALRGMYYFYLVTWFNKPIYYDETNVPINPLVGLVNGNPEQFWNKLEEDLTFASENLPDSWPTSETGRITRGAANAALGKALLYKHYHYYLRFGNGNTTEAKENLSKARAAFKRVIDSDVYHLILPEAKSKANYEAALLSNFSYLDIPVGNNLYKSENNAESVWEVQYNDDNRAAGGWLPGWQWGGNLNYLYFSPSLAGYRNHEIDPTLWYEFETVSGHPGGYDRDPRAYATCYLEGDTLDWREESGYRTGFQSALNAKSVVSKNNLYQGPVPSVAIGLKKYGYPQFVIKAAPNSAPFNVRVIRYSDVLLMYAEASYQYDNDAGGLGLAALNEVRARVDMPAIAALTPAAIIHERTVELATEGHFYNDIIRWTFDPKFPIDLGTLFRNKFNINKNLYFPIPQAEIDANKGTLKQNPNW